MWYLLFMTPKNSRVIRVERPPFPSLNQALEICRFMNDEPTDRSSRMNRCFTCHESELHLFNLTPEGTHESNPQSDPG